jgi:hypothetical protein
MEPQEPKSQFYTAKQARADYEARLNEKNNFVDQKKMADLLSEIRNKIQNNNVYDSKSSSFMYPEIQAGYLSPGEIAFLKKLGYKVEFMDGGMHGDFWKISW